MPNKLTPKSSHQTFGVGVFVPTQWRADGGQTRRQPRASKVGGIYRVRLQKLHFIKLLKIYAFSYRKSTNTCCMDLIRSCLGARCDYGS